MPTYEYRCPNGHDFERFYRKISDAESQVACPECQAIAERRVSGGAGLLFKGSGFYLTDYGRNAHRQAAGDAKGGDAKGGDAKGGDTKAGEARKDGGSGSPAKESKPAAEAKPAKRDGGGSPSK